MKQSQPKIVFLSASEGTSVNYIASLLSRHPELCVYKSRITLLENLMRLPARLVSSKNNALMETVFDFVSDDCFENGFPTLYDLEGLDENKNSFEVFSRLLQLYQKYTRPHASSIVYVFENSYSFRQLFDRYITTNNQAKYIHVMHDLADAENHEPGDIFLSSLCYGILQIRNSDFVKNYEYEYQRMFDFINASQTTAEFVAPGKKFYKRIEKLKETTSNWYNPVNTAYQSETEKVFIR